MEAAFCHTNITVTYRWRYPTVGSQRRTTAKHGPACCGFVVLPESQSQRLIILRHGYFDVVPAAIRLKATDQTWQYEQWLHLKFAGRKHRRDGIPFGLKVAPEICAFQREVGNWRCSPVDEMVGTRHSSASPWSHQAKPWLFDSRGGCTA